MANVKISDITVTTSAAAADLLEMETSGGVSKKITYNNAFTSRVITTPDINGGTADSLTALSIRSTGAAFDLTLATATVFTAGRTLTLATGDAARTITLSGNPTLSDWFDQSVKAAANPTFGNLTITSFAANWTNAGRTIADLGIVTTADINGGTIDGAVIGGAAAAAITGTTGTWGTALQGTTANGYLDLRGDSGATLSSRLNDLGIWGMATTDLETTQSGYAGIHYGAHGVMSFHPSASAPMFYAWNIYLGSDGNYKYRASAAGAQIIFSTSGDIDFGSAPSGTADNTATVTTALSIKNARSVVVGSAALATTATDGFLYIPTCAGTPTGVPTAQTGRVAMIFDTTNNKFWIYDGGWIGTVLS